MALELFRERPVGIVPGEAIEAVAVELQRNAIRAAGAVKDGDVAMKILGGAEPQSDWRGGGVIDQAMKRRRGAALLEPGERAGVELGQLAQRRFPAAATAMLRRGSPARGGLLEAEADLAQRGATDGELMNLTQLLREVDVIEASVGCGQERDDLLTDRWH